MNPALRADLERAGARVAISTDVVMGRSAAPDTDGILAGIASRQRRARTRRNALGAIATTCALVAAATGVGVLARPRAMPTSSAPEVDRRPTGTPPDEAPRTGWGVDDAVADVPLDFPGGTRIVVRPGGTAKLVEVRAHGAQLRLEKGTLTVDVVPTREGAWDIVAGSFAVHVTGTRFDATWDPGEEHLTIAMQKGSVAVHGPCVNEPLAAPQTKTFSCRVPPARATTSARAANPPPRQPGAQALLEAADAARLSGDLSRARALYERVRAESPRSDEAARAAFLLGRIAEAEGSGSEALRWYGAAAREGPNGAFAQEGLGRAMELEERRGEAESARALAEEYLRRFPRGPHGRYAASLLDRADPARTDR